MFNEKFFEYGYVFSPRKEHINLDLVLLGAVVILSQVLQKDGKHLKVVSKDTMIESVIDYLDRMELKIGDDNLKQIQELEDKYPVEFATAVAKGNDNRFVTSGISKGALAYGIFNLLTHVFVDKTTRKPMKWNNKETPMENVARAISATGMIFNANSFDDLPENVRFHMGVLRRDGTIMRKG